ncbi:MAG: hypothetical protein SGJ15_10250 [Bacteroidota bacterium]|nr:hypothetical protein [Bacteroidota bacterium]
MTNPINQSEAGAMNFKVEEKLKRIEAHKTIATHLEIAAKHHYEAAKYQQENENEKAEQSTNIAREHMSLANEAENNETKTNCSNFKL